MIFKADPTQFADGPAGTEARAAKIKWLFTNVETGDKVARGALMKDALALLEESGRLSALDAQQLEWVRAARATLRARTMSLAH